MSNTAAATRARATGRAPCTSVLCGTAVTPAVRHIGTVAAERRRLLSSPVCLLSMFVLDEKEKKNVAGLLIVFSRCMYAACRRLSIALFQEASSLGMDYDGGYAQHLK